MTVFLRFRLLASLSAQEAADRIGVSKVNVLHWESGRHRPRASRLKKIAAVYGCSVADLLDDDEPRKEN